MTNNPLMAFQPHERVYVKLPSLGKFYNEGVIVLDGDEVGIRPMSAKDEMLLNNPDALMNGRAVISVIKNCVPAVLKPNDLSVGDVEALLLGIKLASNEETYDINTKCSECNVEGAFSRDIDSLLTNIETLDDNYMFPLDNGLVFALRPNTWSSHSRLQQLAFRQQRLVTIVRNESMSDQEKQDIFNTVFDEMVDLNMDLMADCIRYVESPNGVVSDTKFIREYIETLSKKEIADLSAEVEKINGTGVSHSMDVCCGHCGHEWTIDNLRFDPSYFFERGSSSRQAKK